MTQPATFPLNPQKRELPGWPFFDDDQISATIEVLPYFPHSRNVISRQGSDPFF